GIGKTRTAQELETYARIRGGQVLWGRAHEAAGAPAYWPWVQALRAYVSSVEPQALSTQIGSGAVEVARIVSEVRERLPGLPEAGANLEPEAAQFRLFDAIATFLKNAATATPLLIVLDDLHGADKPSLLLLQHVAREIGRARLLVVGTYRDVEVGRAHPLAAVLAELQRDALFQRVLLRGLSSEEVEAYIRASAGLDPARELLGAIYQETEGNPFFLAEVVALLVQEGTLQRSEPARRGGATIAVPQSVREVLGRRLDRLSPACNELLTLAAVAGRDFTYALLGAVSGHDDAHLLALIEEAIEGRVIGETERPGAYRFSHALVQETLLGELSTTRRVRLHGQVAEALERLYSERAERHAAELARHFVESATLTRGHAGKGVRYSKLAAEQAEAATA
ncbi:MAG TPA: AAA family ATPase, partial [Vicinamibacteria bacterium]|nr:AAA family ATPase [Vicinamibacteria bacterium]